MSRPRKRMRLDGGVRFDVNAMARAGLKNGTCKLVFTNGEAWVGDLRMDDQHQRGWLHLHLPYGEQTIEVTAVARPFGGYQWYWRCPMTGSRCAVLWKPHGRDLFASQRYWRGRRMAYGSQFLAPHKLAEAGIRRIEERLGSKDDQDGTLYKPKWQRWGTFDRYCARLDKYDEIIEAREQELNVRLVRTLYRLKRRG